MPTDIVVIGGAGRALQTLEQILERVPPSLPAAVMAEAKRRVQQKHLRRKV